MLEKIITHDYGIGEFRHIEVRRITRVMEDGIELSKSYHRHVVSPGDSVEGQNPTTIALAKLFHTPEVISVYKAMVEARQASIG